MARYVLLEFGDNQEAEAFAKAAQEGVLYYTKPHPKLPNEVSVNQARGDIVPRGLWMKPVKFCECNLVGDGDFVKGAKFGVYVHRTCKMPRPGHFQYPKNLLDPKTGLDRTPRLGLGVQEPPTDDPVKLPNNRELPTIQLGANEPTPKGEYDRVKANLDSRP